MFLALALVSAYSGKRIMGKRGDATDQPLLNRRGDQLVGRTATLTEPITNGRGRVEDRRHDVARVGTGPAGRHQGAGQGCDGSRPGAGGGAG